MDRKIYKEIHETWNKIADLYEEKFMFLDIYDKSYLAFLELLSGYKILELGCGPGNITRKILELDPSLDILATDVSVNMVKLTKKNNPIVEVAEMNALNMDQLAGKFSGVLCGFTIPYLSGNDVCQLIQKTYAKLQVDGIFYLSFVPGKSDMSGYKTGSTGDRTYFFYHDENSIVRTLNEFGFQVEYREGIAYSLGENQTETHVIMIAKKRR